MSARRPGLAELLEARVRPAAVGDRHRVERFLAAMDRDGLYQRHFAHGAAPNLELLRRIELADQLADQGQRVALLAQGGDGAVLAHGEYVAENGAAEFALMVLPMSRTRGIGTAVLQALMRLAAGAGQRQMHGMIQAGNTAALRLARGNGFGIIAGDDARVVLVSCELATKPAAVARRDVASREPTPIHSIPHDPDRIPLHRRPGTRAPLWPRCG